MNYTELVQHISDETNLTVTAVKKVMDSLGATITSNTHGGKTTAIKGIGMFNRVFRKARTYRNPQTGGNIEVVEHYTPHFKASTTFKAAVGSK